MGGSGKKDYSDVFILDTGKNIYKFNGMDSGIQERAKGLEVTRFLNENYHEGKCDIDIINDGNLQGELESSRFWNYFGGFRQISKNVASKEDIILKITTTTLYSIEKDKQKKVKGGLCHVGK